MKKKSSALLIGAIFFVLITFWTVQGQAMVSDSITGTIYDYQNPSQPLPGIEVCAILSGADSPFRCTNSDENGVYWFRDIPQSGDFWIAAIPNEPGTFAQNYYPDKFLKHEAATIHTNYYWYPYPYPPSTGKVFSGIDFHLAPGGSVSGQVNSPNFPVCLGQLSGEKLIDCTQTDENGDYRFIGLITQSYYIYAERPAGYLAQYYPASPDLAGATPVEILAPNNTADINFELPPASRISGHIVLEGGPVYQPYPGLSPQPPSLAGVPVCVQPYDQSGVPRCSSTDESGFYQIEYLTEGDYLVWAGPTLGHAVQYYPAALSSDQAMPVSLSPPAVLDGVDMTLPYIEPGETGSISGYVYDTNNPQQPLVGIWICAEFTNGVRFGCSTTNEEGFYWIGYYIEGPNYWEANFRLRAIPPADNSYASVYYPDQFYAQNAELVYVPPTGPGLTDINFHLPPGAGISGVVNFPGLRVCLESQTGLTLECARSGSNGAYSFPHLISQNYLMRVERPDGVAVQYYSNSPDRLGATVLTLNAPQSLEGIDFNLPEIASIFGYVFQEGQPEPLPYPWSGNDLSRVTVCVQPASQFAASRCTTTSTDGYYSFSHLTQDEYILWAEPIGAHARRYYPTGSTFDESIPIHLTPPADGYYYDLMLPELVSSGSSGSLSGSITGSAPGSRACATRTGDYRWVICSAIDEGGYYQIQYIPAGSYLVSARGPENFDIGFYPDVFDPSLATPVEMITVTGISDVNFAINSEAVVVRTETGVDQTIAPTQETQISFENVLQTGYTRLIPLEDPINLPANFQVNGTAFEIETTALFDQAKVCILYSDEGLTGAEEALLKLLHEESGSWVDVTYDGYPDTTLNQICGTVSAFSPFVVALPVQLEIELITAPVDPIRIGMPVSVEVLLKGPVGGAVYPASLDWGDGSTSSESIVEGRLVAEHIYQLAGIDTIKVMVSGSGGATAEQDYQYIVVYDPIGGFVTGGGWINSPAGAYVLDPGLAGKAIFGFVSKYLKGASLPSGNSVFVFEVAGLEFKSSFYDWLVIAGAKAQFKGSGTINGAGHYGFMLTVVDGQANKNTGPDLFRIKIWDKASGEPVYDNQMKAADDALPTTVISGGNIVVHK